MEAKGSLFPVASGGAVVKRRAGRRRQRQPPDRASAGCELELDPSVLPVGFRGVGRVQGVGFRAFVWREAAALGVSGWVRNRLDGTVEALVGGSPEALDALRARIEQGPRWGRVDRVGVNEEPDATDLPDGFVIRSDR